MRKIVVMFLLVIFLSLLTASNHGMYLKLFTDIQMDINEISSLIETEFVSTNYSVLFNDYIATPDIVQENQEDHCDYQARLIVLSSDKYVRMLTSFGNKYLTAAFLRIGLYETKTGVQVVISDPETVNRIIFNDLPDEKYNEVVNRSKKFKTELINILHQMDMEQKVEEMMKPVRSAKDLKKAAKDMMMMVGKMTFYKDEDQFPIIYSEKTEAGISDLNMMKKKLLSNLNIFTPSEQDIKYHWTKSSDNLSWEVISEIYSPDSTAVLLGISRERTTALSFHIAGMKRSDDGNKCPGIDHVCAYPIEVLIMLENDELIVRTPREMFRMDMYFWDAGKWAFMKFMNMPKTLDKSIKRALLNSE
ncbi:MAG: hypothetical protein H8E57_08230 [Candidatus Cloacimonetes bacterium]|nr:hypothetical protein [Candidatus Cloacimonadota bacterium]